MKLISGLILCGFLSSCGEHREFLTLDGHPVTLPTCQRAIKYRGNSFTLNGASTKSAKVANTEWETIFRDTKPLIEALDSSQYRTCRSLPTIASTRTLAEFKTEEASIRANQQKLDQFAFLVAAENTEALKRFVSIYFFPVSDEYFKQQISGPASAGAEDQEDRNPILVAKTTETNQAYKIADIDATSAKAIIGR